MSLARTSPLSKVNSGVILLIDTLLSICDSIEQAIDTELLLSEAMRQSILKDAFEGRI